MSEIPAPIETRWRAYPTYKASGVAWLGDIPEHWQVKRLRFMCTFNPSKAEVKDIPDGTQISFLPMDAIGDDGTLDLSEIRLIEQLEAGYTYFRDGDVVVAKITPCFENGKGALVNNLQNGIGFGTTELYVLRVSEEVDNKYLYYLTYSHSFRIIGKFMMRGAAGQQRVPELFIKDFPILPPPEEQQAIADFLDRETAKIDDLIAKKQALIARLREERSAVISHAVTKGLDPSAPMRDSGIAWLGDIPQGWEVKRLKFITSHIGSGKTPRGGSEVYQQQGVLFIRSQNVHVEGMRLDDVVYISDEIDKDMSSSRVFSNDVLLNITGASLGRSSLVPNDFARANVNQHVCIVRPIVNQVHPSFLHNLLASDVVQTQIFSTENGTSREGITFQQIGNFWLVIPPDMDEQKHIVDYIHAETAKIDGLIKQTQASIATLREYRTALISAAVTGKIDVRGEVAP